MHHVNDKLEYFPPRKGSQKYSPYSSGLEIEGFRILATKAFRSDTDGQKKSNKPVHNYKCCSAFIDQTLTTSYIHVRFSAPWLRMVSKNCPQINKHH